MKRQLHLNLFIQSRGHHEASWRHPDSSPLALTDVEYFRDLARRAEAGLFDSIFLADTLALMDTVAHAASTWLEPITTLGAIAGSTSHIGLIATASTTYSEPFNLARQFGSLDHISGGRVGWNIVTSWLAAAARNYGGESLVSHDERYEHAREFLHVWTRLLQGEEVTYEGKHVKVKGARQLFPAVQKPYPPLYFGGSSDAAHDLAAEQVELYLTWGEPPAEVEKKFNDVRRRAEKLGRKVKFGVRLHVIPRETNDEAWAAADRLISHLDDATIAKAQANIATMDSEGQKRMAALHGGNRARLEISPNLWAGVGLVRGGAGTALVGDGETIARRLKEYQDIGAETFVLSGYPHLEEAYRFAELVFPHVGIQAPGQIKVAPVGEIMGNAVVPPVAKVA